MATDLSAVVEAYWRHHRLSQGDRAARSTSHQLDWAVEAVADALEGDDPLALLDLLVESEDADLCFLGAGPVEDLLCLDPKRWDDPLAERCRQSERWRRALACVWLDEYERKALVALQSHLGPEHR